MTDKPILEAAQRATAAKPNTTFDKLADVKPEKAVTISQLVAKLNRIREEQGDLPVYTIDGLCQEDEAWPMTATTLPNQLLVREKVVAVTYGKNRRAGLPRRLEILV